MIFKLNSQRNRCGQMSMSLRREFEDLFRYNLEGVSIHIGPEAESVGARAFALQNRIYFRPGAYSPATREGRWLLGHELAHVVQYRQKRLIADTGQAEPLVQERCELEEEADCFGNLALKIEPAPDWRLLDSEAARLEGGCLIQRNVLFYENKVELRKAIEELIKQYPPAPSATTPQAYRDDLVQFIREHPHIFTGEKFTFPEGKDGAPTGKFRTRLPYYIKSGVRIDLSHFQHGDWRWLEKAVLNLAEKIRYSRPHTRTANRILSEGDNQWVAWESSDCVFTAILIVLGLRFTGDSKQVQAAERQVTTSLATALEIPMRTIPDHLLVVLLEERLGWKRMPVDTLQTLYTKALKGKTYVVTYCENARTDFWHTIYGEFRGGTSWTWVDRQYERKFNGGKKTLPKGDPKTEANAWEIDERSALVAQLKENLNIAGLKTTYADFLA
jgi:hypothetical protein